MSCVQPNDDHSVILINERHATGGMRCYSRVEHTNMVAYDFLSDKMCGRSDIRVISSSDSEITNTLALTSRSGFKSRLRYDTLILYQTDDFTSEMEKTYLG